MGGRERIGGGGGGTGRRDGEVCKRGSRAGGDMEEPGNWVGRGSTGCGGERESLGGGGGGGMGPGGDVGERERSGGGGGDVVEGSSRGGGGGDGGCLLGDWRWRSVARVEGFDLVLVAEDLVQEQIVFLPRKVVCRRHPHSPAAAWRWRLEE